jgi:hypothetical protein
MMHDVVSANAGIGFGQESPEKNNENATTSGKTHLIVECEERAVDPIVELRKMYYKRQMHWDAH